MSELKLVRQRAKTKLKGGKQSPQVYLEKSSEFYNSTFILCTSIFLDVSEKIIIEDLWCKIQHFSNKNAVHMIK